MLRDTVMMILALLDPQGTAHRSEKVDGLNGEYIDQRSAVMSYSSSFVLIFCV